MSVGFDFDELMIVRETTKAMLISINPLHSFWLPKSLIHRLPGLGWFHGYIPDDFDVYDAETRQPIDKHYIDNRLNCCAGLLNHD